MHGRRPPVYCSCCSGGNSVAQRTEEFSISETDGSGAVGACLFFFSSRRRHTRFDCDWSSDVCSSDLWDDGTLAAPLVQAVQGRSVIPQSFVISRDGRIVKHFTGFSLLSTPKLMREIGRASCRERV